MRLRLAVLGFALGVSLVLLTVAVVSADVIDGTKISHATLAAAQVATGQSANSVCTGPPRSVGAPPVTVCGMGDLYSIVFTYKNTAGTASVRALVNCNGDGWIPVCNSSRDLTTGSGGTDGSSVIYPGCQYASEVTACAGCSVTTSYSVGLPIK